MIKLRDLIDEKKCGIGQNPEDTGCEPASGKKGKSKKQKRPQNKPDYKKTGTWDEGSKKAKSSLRKKFKELGIKPLKQTGSSVHGFQSTQQRGYTMKGQKTKYGEVYRTHITFDEKDEDKQAAIEDYLREQGYDVESGRREFYVDHVPEDEKRWIK